MNRVFTKIAVVLLLSTMTFSQLQAQFTTAFAKNVNPGQQSGFYYSLPQTMIQLDFVLEEADCEPGPLANYASTYFGDVEVIEYAAKNYKILDVKMKTVATPDPNATFFVTVGSARGGNKAVFDILPNGIIRSVGSGAALSSESESQPESVNAISTDGCNSIARKRGFVKLMTSGKTDAQLAREAADKIAEIRKAKMNLLGFYETAYLPETFKEMYAKLETMEEDYMSLFLGNRNARTIVKSVYVIPSKDVTTQTVAKFSEREGVSAGTSGTGSPITVQTLSLNGTAAINAPSQSAVESMSYENRLFYRVPETANVKVSFKNEVLLEERLTVNQLGVLLMVPFTNTMMEFDTSTGQIVNFKMQ